jgi:hypothetical protein
MHSIAIGTKRFVIVVDNSIDNDLVHVNKVVVGRNCGSACIANEIDTSITIAVVVHIVVIICANRNADDDDDDNSTARCHANEIRCIDVVCDDGRQHCNRRQQQCCYGQCDRYVDRRRRQ